MPAWRRPLRVVIVVSWFYEVDSRVKPQVPYAVFPLDGPCWFMAGVGSPLAASELGNLSVAVITVDPNQVLQSVGHHRSPALLRTPEEVHSWLHGSPQEALALLRPYPNEAMGVEAVPMNIKIPGNENIVLPEHLQNRSTEPA